MKKEKEQLESDFETRVKETAAKEVQKVERDLVRKYRGSYERDKKVLNE